MNELSIEPGYLRILILKVRALLAKEENVMPETGGNPSDDASPEALQDWPGDLTREEIVEEFEGLNQDQHCELVALMWIGRGDAEPQEWADTLELANQRREGPTVDYLLGHPLVADYWVIGLEKLGHGSRVLEAGEY